MGIHANIKVNNSFTPNDLKWLLAVYSKPKVAWKSHPKAGMVKSTILFEEDTQISSCIEIFWMFYLNVTPGSDWPQINSLLMFDSVEFDNLPVTHLAINRSYKWPGRVPGLVRTC